MILGITPLFFLFVSSLLSLSCLDCFHGIVLVSPSCPYLNCCAVALSLYRSFQIAHICFKCWIPLDGNNAYNTIVCQKDIRPIDVDVEYMTKRKEKATRSMQAKPKQKKEDAIDQSINQSIIRPSERHFKRLKFHLSLQDQRRNPSLKSIPLHAELNDNNH